jgi:hypothetical protein
VRWHHQALQSGAEEGQDQYLLLALAIAAERRGVSLAENEVYAFTPPPISGISVS